jgi:alkylhydroperoxidase family enzyme
VTRAQWECGEADVAGLRQAGWSDEAVVDTVGIIAFFNFITRVADALGVELNVEYQKAFEKVDYARMAE